MAKSDREGVGDIQRVLRQVDAEYHLNHAPHLFLVATALASDRLLYFCRWIVEDGQACSDGRQHDASPCLTNGERGAARGPDYEWLLYCDGCGAYPLDHCRDARMHLPQPLLDRLFGRGADRAAIDEGRVGSVALDESVAGGDASSLTVTVTV